MVTVVMLFSLFLYSSSYCFVLIYPGKRRDVFISGSEILITNVVKYFVADGGDEWRSCRGLPVHG